MSVLPPQGLTEMAMNLQRMIQEYPTWTHGVRFTPRGSDICCHLLQNIASGVSNMESECPFYLQVVGQRWSSTSNVGFRSIQHGVRVSVLSPEGLTDVAIYFKRRLHGVSNMESECPFCPQGV